MNHITLTDHIGQRNLAGHLHRLSRTLSALSEHRWARDGYPDMRSAHVQLLRNLDETGTRGTVLAQRDPSPLFDALKLMGDAGRDVRVVFLGPNGPDIRNHLRRLASERGVTDQLVFRDTVPHVDALRLQRRADVLLLLMWNNPLERGVYTGKLFSYIGARRPIFSVGMSDGVAADLIREHQLGFAVDTPAAIAQQLSLWLEEKRIHGRLAAPKCANVDEFTREAQTRKLEQVLLSVVARTAAHHVTS